MLFFESQTTALACRRAVFGIEEENSPFAVEAPAVEFVALIVYKFEFGGDFSD